MRVNSIISLNFKRRLRPNEEADFAMTLKQGKEKIGNTGHSMLIVPSTSLPQKINTGVGNILDEEALKFFDFAKQYWGINYVQLLPEGTYRHHNNIFLPYSGSAFDLGPQLINFNLLTENEYGNLLNKSDIERITSANSPLKEQGRISFENIIPKHSSGQKLLRKAFNELHKSNSPEKEKLLKEIENYAQINKEWLEPKSIYEALAEKYQTYNTQLWSEIDKNLYNIDIVSIDQRKSAIDNIKNSELKKEIQFYEFKQFLAEKHLAKARAELNKKGIKLSGDMLIGFSYDEVWANPKAFIENTTIGWGIPAVNFETKEGEMLLRNKVNKFAQRYDGLRLDASWTYISQPLKNKLSKNQSKKEYGSKILDIIDDEIKKVKGENFNFENITHEFIADKKDFSMYDSSEIKPYCRDRVKIQTSNYLNNGHGTTSAYKKQGWQDCSYILGVSNHDSTPLLLEFENVSKRKGQIDVLSDILKIPKENINTYSEFSQAKLAEPIRSKHNMFFFTDVLNILERYKDNPNRVDDYRLKISNNYQEKYFKSLEKGNGLNIMDALEKAFVADGLDKKEPELYKKIIKYKKILQSPEKKSPNKLITFGIIGGLLSALALLLVFKNKRAENFGPSK